MALDAGVLCQQEVNCQHPHRALAPLERLAPPEARYTVLHDGQPVLLDHILASQTLAAACKGVRILNAGLADEAHVCGPVKGSLHAPVLAIFD